MDDSRGQWQLRLWTAVLIAAPLWWLLGLNLFVYHAVALLLFTGLLYEAGRRNQILRIPPLAFFPICIGITFAVSILVHMGAHDTTRVMAAGYNLSFWIIGALLIISLANCYSRSFLPRFSRAFAILAVVNSAMILIGVLAAWQGLTSLAIATPLSGLTKLLGTTALVDYSVNARLITTDWFASETRPRLNFYAPYPTATAAFLMISLAMLITWAGTRKKGWSLAPLLLVGINSLGLLLTLSRTAVAAFLFSSAAVFIVRKRSKWVWLALGFPLVVLAFPWLEQAASAILTAREGSTLSRFELYRYSISQLHDLDWVLGLGIRPRLDSFGMPTGSHSTYVALLFKTGLCGFVAFIIFQIVLLTRWFGLKDVVSNRREDLCLWRGFGIVFLGMAIWMLTEDIDAPQLLAFVYFSCIGVFEGFRRVTLSRAALAPQAQPVSP